MRDFIPVCVRVCVSVCVLERLDWSWRGETGRSVWTCITVCVSQCVCVEELAEYKGRGSSVWCFIPVCVCVCVGGMGRNCFSPAQSLLSV